MSSRWEVAQKIGGFANYNFWLRGEGGALERKHDTLCPGVDFEQIGEKGRGDLGQAGFSEEK